MGCQRESDNINNRDVHQNNVEDELELNNNPPQPHLEFVQVSDDEEFDDEGMIELIPNSGVSHFVAQDSHGNYRWRRYRESDNSYSWCERHIDADGIAYFVDVDEDGNVIPGQGI